MVENRTTKLIRNTFYSFTYKLSDVILNFILRTIFLRTLGITFLGVSSLFTNVLSILSLMELGVGSAIVFSLYEPLANNDHEKIASLMKLYKKAYIIIGSLVAIVGFSLTPFLPSILTLPEEISNINIIYWLYVANSSVSYFLAYRRTLLTADQKAYINTKNLMLFRCSRFLLLTLVLLSTHNFFFYLVTDILNTLASNIHITYIVKKQYSYLDDITPKPLEKEEKTNIVKYVSSGILAKIGQTVVTSTDNIIISAFISTISVGLYANYNMVFSGVDTMVYLVFTNLTASVGNFAVEKNGRDAELLFNKIYFINYVIVSVISVAMFSLLTPFIRIWLGDGYVLSETTVLVIVLNFYLTGMCNSTGNFLGAVGELYYINRFRALIEAVVNLTTSIILVKVLNLGITGVFLGTTICFICGRIWMDPMTLYKHWFKIPFSRYVSRYVSRFVLFVISACLVRLVTEKLFDYMGVSLLSWIIAGCISVILSMTILIIIYRRTEEYLYFRAFVDKILKTKIRH